MSCFLKDLNSGNLSPLTPGATQTLDKYGRYDVKCDMVGAEFVKFRYSDKSHDAWDPPFVFSGFPDADPGCNDQVKFLSGGCGATCSGTKTITVLAQQLSEAVCLKYDFHFKCGSNPQPPAPSPPAPAPTRKQSSSKSDDSDDDSKDYDKKKDYFKKKYDNKKDDSDDESKDYDKKKYGDKKDDSDDESKDYFDKKKYDDKKDDSDDEK
jgi:hypothetical protein